MEERKENRVPASPSDVKRLKRDWPMYVQRSRSSPSTLRMSAFRGERDTPTFRVEPRNSIESDISWLVDSSEPVLRRRQTSRMQAEPRQILNDMPKSDTGKEGIDIPASTLALRLRSPNDRVTLPMIIEERGIDDSRPAQSRHNLDSAPPPIRLMPLKSVKGKLTRLKRLTKKACKPNDRPSEPYLLGLGISLDFGAMDHAQHPASLSNRPFALSMSPTTESLAVPITLLTRATSSDRVLPSQRVEKGTPPRNKLLSNIQKFGSALRGSASSERSSYVEINTPAPSRVHGSTRTFVSDPELENMDKPKIIAMMGKTNAEDWGSEVEVIEKTNDQVKKENDLFSSDEFHAGAITQAATFQCPTGIRDAVEPDASFDNSDNDSDFNNLISSSPCGFSTPLGPPVVDTSSSPTDTHSAVDNDQRQSFHLRRSPGIHNFGVSLLPHTPPQVAAVAPSKKHPPRSMASLVGGPDNSELAIIAEDDALEAAADGSPVAIKFRRRVSILLTDTSAMGIDPLQEDN